ncbi:MAG: large-conductance mechanosensitive channel protein MscL [Phycisphaeraceae bacterium]|nr:MAG: large-conductance mechanosensitive channel protein MscL [Phycisphaeraceae bacterium]
MGIIKEFREFAMKGNVVDLAVGVIIGAAFGSVVGSMVNDIFNPVLGYIIRDVDFASLKIVVSDASAEVRDASGAVTEKARPEVAVMYGKFINACITFVIQAFAVFIVIKAMNTARKRFEKEQQAAPPAGPPADVVLLTEIRDLLKRG